VGLIEEPDLDRGAADVGLGHRLDELQEAAHAQDALQRLGPVTDRVVEATAQLALAERDLAAGLGDGHTAGE